VLLARALVGEPEVLILDEPTANIDQRLEGEIFELLAALNDHLTIVVVSHDIGFISSYVSQVACLNRTLVCHQTEAINGDLIDRLYGEPVRMIAHGHTHGQAREQGLDPAPGHSHRHAHAQTNVQAAGRRRSDPAHPTVKTRAEQHG
jgi:zinc transport system ATP-binding protein